MTMPDPVVTYDYERGTPEKWAEGVKQLRLNGTEIEGPCPRCGHTFRQDLTRQMGVALKAETGGNGPLRVRLVCSCEGYHKGAPSDTRGCGAEGGVQVRAGAVTVTDAPLTSEEWAADNYARQVLKERLPRVRAAAEKWGTTMSALTALFGGAILVSSDTVVRSLQATCAYVFGGLTGLALATAAASILQAAGAAHASVEMPPDAPGRLKVYDDLVRKTDRRLAWSRNWALLAALLFIGSLVARWYGPVNTPTP